MVKNNLTNSVLSKWDAHLINNADEIEKEFQESQKAWTEASNRFDEDLD